MSGCRIGDGLASSKLLVVRKRNMNFDEACQFLKELEPKAFHTKTGEPFTFIFRGDSIVFRPRGGQGNEKPQSMERFSDFFHKYFFEGKRSNNDFRNRGGQGSPSGVFSYFTAVFRMIEAGVHDGPDFDNNGFNTNATQRLAEPLAFTPGGWNMSTIQQYINDRNKYKVDHTYQRPDGAWTNEDNQCFIDTILRDEPIPNFFLNHDSKINIYYIVDGQQRLNCISKFYENKIKLNAKFSGNVNHGKTFNGENPLTDDQKTRFRERKLNFHIMEDYDDERVRLLFSRLQRGKPLVLGERLNAKPGNIVQSMRAIEKHPFMTKSIAVAKNRYGVYPDAARILFYEKFKAKQCGTNELFHFFDINKDLDQSSSEYKSAISVLNYLEKCFPAIDGPHSCFEKHAWVLAVYTMVRELRVGYSLIGQEKNIFSFINDFHRKVYDEDFRNSKPDYQRFYNNIRGGWSEKIIALRRNMLINKFLIKYNVLELDDKRQISDEDKISLFSVRHSCERCNCKLKHYRDAEYHHKELYSEGGETKKENIMVLCHNCHEFFHGRNIIDIPSEKELSQDEEE
jgi:hypothetical protein